jgi:hypothetical protein
VSLTFRDVGKVKRLGKAFRLVGWPNGFISKPIPGAWMLHEDECYFFWQESAALGAQRC